MDITKMKAIELVLDWNLWPRQSIGILDSTNLRQMEEALKAGYALPPVIASAKDFRVTDGFHRITAILSVFGEDADIEVFLRDYNNDAEMFLDAGRMNSHHGLPMRPKDRAHFILRARKFKIPPIAIAEVLGMDVKLMKDFICKRSATTEAGEVIPLPAGALNLGGKTLTQTQEHYARTANGGMPEMYVNMLLNAIRADALLLSDKTIVKLGELRDEIERILSEAA
jgi:hypothetical protein